jgi:DNA-binding CsgD family transcriptional regulator
VDALALIQAFVECCERNAPIEELVANFQATIERLGFRYFACCAHVDPLHPPKAAVMLHNYPREWVRTFSELTLHEVDPVLLYSEHSPLPFSWDEAAFRTHLTKPQKTILDEAATLGLSHGYTIPIHLPREWGAQRASCSIVPETGKIHPHGQFVAQFIASYLYHAASRQLSKQHVAGERVALTARERQCLELAAHGKSDWVIGRVLGLSECTVHTYIERAKRRMGVVTRVQAIVEALTAKQISYCDIVRAENAE